MHVIERDRDGTYAFVTCNTGDGLGYHPVYAGDYPKRKQKTSMRFGGISPKRILTPAVWYLFFKQKVTAVDENGPEILYEVILPFLAGERQELPSRAAIKGEGEEEEEENGRKRRGKSSFASHQLVSDLVDRDIATSGHWESIQRAGTCYFRCILCTIRYLLKSDGFNQLQQKQLFVQIRAGFLDAVEQDLLLRKDAVSQILPQGRVLREERWSSCICGPHALL